MIKINKLCRSTFEEFLKENPSLEVEVREQVQENKLYYVARLAHQGKILHCGAEGFSVKNAVYKLVHVMNEKAGKSCMLNDKYELKYPYIEDLGNSVSLGIEQS